MDLRVRTRALLSALCYYTFAVDRLQRRLGIELRNDIGSYIADLIDSVLSATIMCVYRCEADGVGNHRLEPDGGRAPTDRCHLD